MSSSGAGESGSCGSLQDCPGLGFMEPLPQIKMEAAKGPYMDRSSLVRGPDQISCPVNLEKQRDPHGRRSCLKMPPHWQASA